jgi:type II secretory pathway pseudopilin PulG
VPLPARGLQSERPGVARAAGGVAGFTLVEALVGLALLGLVLTLGLAALYRMPAAMRRAQARLEAERAAEAVLESVRAGELVLAPGRIELPAMAPPRPAAERMRVRLEVQATDVAGLWALAVEVRYRVEGLPRRSALDSLAWRPAAEASP